MAWFQEECSSSCQCRSVDINVPDLVGEIADQDWDRGYSQPVVSVLDWRTGSFIFHPDPRLWRQALWKALPDVVSRTDLARMLRGSLEGSIMSGNTRVEWATVESDTFVLVKFTKLKKPLVKSLMPTTTQSASSIPTVNNT